ncbi:MAG: peptide deformylase [Bacteroidetes bacterium]|nr:MAG: peptide deformylase [Bacteroidota bacterium]
MILPIYGYGHQVLREKGKDIGPEYPNLEAFIENMFETMYNAQGVGLAAPQVGVSIRLFVVDASPMADAGKDADLQDFKRVFINPEIIAEKGDIWAYEEGCLSIPDIREQVRRHGEIVIRYLDEKFVAHEETFDGMKARIIQHEYDHIQGVLFTDRISPMRKNVNKARMQKISQGQIDPAYRMRFAGK